MPDAVAIGEMLQVFSANLQKQLGGKVFTVWVPEYKVNHSVDVLKTIIPKVCGVAWEQMVSPCRKREITIARHLYCWFAYKNYKQKLKSIGETFGGRDHTTAIHGYQTVQDLLDSRNEMLCSYFIKIQDEILKHEESKIETKTPALAAVS